MDSGLSSVATSLWSAASGGDPEQRGMPAGGAPAQVLERLWTMLRAHRERRGHFALPVNRDELYLSLLELLLDDEAARSLAAQATSYGPSCGPSGQTTSSSA